MNLSLYDTKQLVATENIPCDAVQSFKDYYWAIPDTEIKTKEKFIFDLFKIRKMKIQPTETYLNITLLDNETGEQLEMNVKRGVHKLCLTRNIYPHYLSKLFI